MPDPSAGEVITDRPGRRLLLLVATDDLSVTWGRYAAGERGPGLHVHHEHTDSFYVLEGSLTVGVGADGETVTIGPGGFVSVPPGVAHSFDNDGDADVCYVNVHSPDGGFARFLRGARDGTGETFDSHPVPPDGGRSASEVTVVPEAPG